MSGGRERRLGGRTVSDGTRAPSGSVRVGLVGKPPGLTSATELSRR
jgi:hypothetical protein